MGKTDVGPTAVADCGPMKMPMEARHRADEFCQLGAVNAFKAHLDKFWQQQLVKFDFTADLTGTGNR